MSENISDRLERTFGSRGLRSPLFYNFSSALRFELGGDESDAIPRFVRAFSRARQIVQAVFLGADRLAAVAVQFGAASDEASLPTVQLSAFGFHHAFDGRERTLDDSDQDGPMETIYRYWSSVEFTPTTGHLDALVWACLSVELPIEPRAQAKLYIVDFDRRIAVHPYDDRGMDVVAMDRATLAPIYEGFESWLLDYDRARMDAVFAGTTRQH